MDRGTPFINVDGGVGNPFFQGNILYICKNKHDNLPITCGHFLFSNMNCHLINFLFYKLEIINQPKN